MENTNAFFLNTHQRANNIRETRVTAPFVFCVINFELIEVQTFSAPQNDNNNNNFVDGGKLAKNGQKTAILTGSWGQLPIDNEYAGLL